MAPRPIFPVCPDAARSGRRQGAQHPLAKAARASGETGPTWIRDVAVKKGTRHRNETSRNSSRKAQTEPVSCQLLTGKQSAQGVSQHREGAKQPEQSFQVMRGICRAHSDCNGA